MSKKSNGDDYNNLSDEEKMKFREIYKKHPLADFIDWRRYYASADGNAMNFVKCLDEYIDEQGNQVYVLEKVVLEHLDYILIFVCGENAFYKVPDNSMSKTA